MTSSNESQQECSCMVNTSLTTQELRELLIDEIKTQRKILFQLEIEMEEANRRIKNAQTRLRIAEAM